MRSGSVPIRMRRQGESISLLRHLCAEHRSRALVRSPCLVCPRSLVIHDISRITHMCIHGQLHVDR